MIGSIAGDIIGSIYEKRPIKTKDFPLFKKYSRFTDDTVMSIAVADCLLEGKPYAETLRSYGQKYPKKGYGAKFMRWILGEIEGPYHSFGNGSAMRVSAVGFALESKEQVLTEAERSAIITHNHPEGIKGAKAIALAVFLAKTGTSKDEIRQQISSEFAYDLNRKLEQVRATYTFDVTCQGSVPEAILSFLESDSYEDAIRNAISLGGDSDTLACMAGGIAEAYYKVIPAFIVEETKRRLKPDLLEVLERFEGDYGVV